MFHVLNSFKNIVVGHFTRRRKLPHSTLTVKAKISPWIKKSQNHGSLKRPLYICTTMYSAPPCMHKQFVVNPNKPLFFMYRTFSKIARIANVWCKIALNTCSAFIMHGKGWQISTYLVLHHPTQTKMN